MPIFVAIGITLIIVVAYRLYKHLIPSANINGNGKYVLISGCDTGFGHALAIDLDRQGFHVLAGIYHSHSEQILLKHLSNRATVFSLDVTSNHDINAAYKMIKEKTPVLHALVNNAGIGKAGLIDWTSVDFMRRMMDVNFFGHVTMTKTFLPLLLSTRGSRIVNVCSAAGFIAGPGGSAYSASKFALEAFSDSLRREMHAWGLHVSIIEPGFMRTPIIDGFESALSDLWNGLEDETKRRWGEPFYRQLNDRTLTHPFIQHAENPQKVIKALRHAVMNKAPCIRYRPGWQSSLFYFPLSMLPAWLTDFIIIRLRGINVLPAGIAQQVQ
jgi:short-chain dehydrogenase/reductase family 9C member 7